MNPSQIYVALTIVAFVLIAILVFVVKKRKAEKTLTPLAGLAFGFVLAGLFFGDERLIGYSLLGVGVILAVIDIVKKFRTQQ